MKTPKKTPKPRTRLRTFREIFDSVRSPFVRKKLDRFAKVSAVATHMASLRTKAGLTQGQLAAEISLSQSVVSRTERGPDGDLTLERIADYGRVLKQPITLTLDVKTGFWRVGK